MTFSAIKIGLWNARGIVKKSEELRLFLIDNSIDIMLITETHMRPGLKMYLPGYDQYFANHPSNTAKGGSAILIKTNIIHTQTESTTRTELQLASLDIPTNGGVLKIASLYLPPSEPWTKNDFDQLLASLGPKFLAGGDFNAKHQWWGNLRSCCRGKRLQEAIVSSSCQILATGGPTFYSSNTRLTPTALDFFIVNGVQLNQLSIETKYELSSDHLSIVATLSQTPQYKAKRKPLLPPGSSVEKFKETLDRSINLNTVINHPDDLEDAVTAFMEQIYIAATAATRNKGNLRIKVEAICSHKML